MLRERKSDRTVVPEHVADVLNLADKLPDRYRLEIHDLVAGAKRHALDGALSTWVGSLGYLPYEHHIPALIGNISWHVNQDWD